jgi:hypothetical protein
MPVVGTRSVHSLAERVTCKVPSLKVPMHKVSMIKVPIVPDKRSRILEVVIVRRLVIWVLGIWRGEGLGKGLRKGRSVNKQPETKVDVSCHS